MKCPGQDMQFWDNEAIFDVKCPECGKMVEFYKDDTTRKCHHCGHRFVNPKMDFGCATYCQFAEQCLGTLPEEFVLQQDSLLKDKVAVAVKRYFKNDFKQIRLTTQIAAHAEKIGKSTEDANLALILCSAYLLLVVKNDKTTGSEATASTKLQQEEKNLVEEILQGVGANQQLVEQVCRIVGNGPEDSKIEQDAHAIVYDAYRITMMEKVQKEESLTTAEIEAGIERMLSESAKEEARRVLVS